MKLHIPILLILFLFSCKTEIVKKPELKKYDKLTAFLNICRSDLQKAGTVIANKDIVKNLTHLQFMNAGGKRYYLLERENISRMISAVTEGVYSDYILVNKKGTILYTRENDQLFSKNVRSHLKTTPLKVAYDKRDLPVFFSDVTMMNNFSGNHLMFVSKKVSGGNSFPGLLILQVDAATLLQYLEPGEEIISNDGIYLLSEKKDRIMQPCQFFNELGIKDRRNQEGKKKLSDGRSVYFKNYRYESLNWILIKVIY